MVYVVGAELDVVVGLGRVVEIDTSRDVADARLVGHLGRVLAHIRTIGVFVLQGEAYLVAILGVGHRGVHEYLGVDDVVPTHRTHDVAPAVAQLQMLLVVGAVEYALLGFETCIEDIVADIERAVQAATVGELVRDLGIGVVEIVASRSAHIRRQREQRHSRLHEEVGVGAASRKAEGGLLLHNGAFDGQLGGDQARRHQSVVFFVVAVVGGDVYYAREASAEMGGEAALVHRHVLDGVGVEGREETTEVVDVVERHPVEQEQVLVGTAAAHIETAGALGARLDARHELKRFQYIGFAKQYGDGFDMLKRHLDGAYLRRAQASDTLGAHGDLFQFDARIERHVEFEIARKHGVELERSVSHVAHPKAHAVVLRHGEAVEAVGVAQHTFAAAFVHHRRADERLAALAVGDDAADRLGGEIVICDQWPVASDQ